MPRPAPRIIALLAVLLTALLSACGTQDAQQAPPPPPTLPEGAELLADAAAAMRTVTSTRISIAVDGDPPGIPIHAAEAQVSQDGKAKGIARTDQAGQVVELTFVIVGDSLYVRGPTGGFRELPVATLGVVYDPSKLLDPEVGVAAVLASGAAATTEGRDRVGGVDSYRVRASFSAESLRRLVPGATQEATGQVWISAEDSRLLQAVFPATGGAISFQLDDFDAPADIRAPR